MAFTIIPVSHLSGLAKRDYDRADPFYGKQAQHEF